MRPERRFKSLALPVKAGESLSVGDLVALKDGELVLGRSESGLVGAYVVDGAGGVIESPATVSVGCWLFGCNESVSSQNIGSVVYIYDRDTVSLDETGRSPAGVIRDVAVGGQSVWVELKGGL